MKAQFKYAFLTGLRYRGPVFVIIFTMNILFVLLGSFDLLPLAAKILFTSLSGIAAAVMLAANIAADVTIAKRMFSAPGAYLDMLTPVPRWKILFASVMTMAVMDLLTMTLITASQVWLTFNMVGNDIYEMVWEIVRENSDQLINALMFFLLIISCYFLLVMIILFCVTMRKSLFFKTHAPGFLSFLLAVGCVYIISLMQLVLVPFCEVSRIGFIITITPVSPSVLPLFALLALLEATVLFVITSKLLERKINL